jgi:hypothetical protein
MSWSARQTQRIYLEERVVARELPQFAFTIIESLDLAYATGWERSPYNTHDYYLTVVIPRGFPEQMPHLYIDDPYPLRRRDGSGIPSHSHAFHTGRIDSTTGRTEICHCSSDDWDPSMTCTGVFLRGILWLHCYEQHLRTGRTIEDVYEELRRRIG